MLLNILFIKQESLNKVLDTTVQYVHYNIQVVYGAGYSWTETNVPVYYAKIRSITVQYNIQVVYGAGYSWTETNVPVYYAKIRSITVQYIIQVVYGAGYSWTETNFLCTMLRSDL